MKRRLILFIGAIVALSNCGLSADGAPVDENTFIAVVGGTTFGTPLEFGEGYVEDLGSFRFETNAGPSPEIFKMKYKGVSFYYIPIYGFMDKQPGEDDGIYHVRTWTALYELGVTHAISGATSGGIDPDLDFDDIVMIDDFM